MSILKQWTLKEGERLDWEREIVKGEIALVIKKLKEQDIRSGNHTRERPIDNTSLKKSRATPTRSTRPTKPLCPLLLMLTRKFIMLTHFLQS